MVYRRISSQPREESWIQSQATRFAEHDEHILSFPATWSRRTCPEAADGFWELGGQVDA